MILLAIMWLHNEDSDGQKASLGVNVASGGMFPPDFNQVDVMLNNWGQFESEFTDCDNGLFS